MASGLGSLGSVARGCGPTRKAGRAYLEVVPSKHGQSLESFLVDPPQPVDLAALGISEVGVHVLPVRGQYHVFDVVGQESYANVADFLAEAARYGISRHIQRTARFERLGPGSRLVLIHARAWLDNHAAYVAAFAAEGARYRDHACPKRLPAHDPAALAGAATTCAAVWWDDLDPRTCELVLDPDLPPRTAERAMPAFSYRARRRPAGVRPRYRHAVFLTVPITRLGVVRDPAAAGHLAALELARRSGLEVQLFDE